MEIRRCGSIIYIMTKKEIEKEQSQKTHSKPEKEDIESASESENQSRKENGNGEVTLRDVVEVLKEGFSTLSDKLDTVSGKLDTVSSRLDTVSDKLDTVSGKLDTISGKLDTVSRKLDSIDGTLKNLRGDITEMSLYSLLTDYMIEEGMHREFTLLDAPRKVERGEADFVLLADGKTIYIVEVKTSISGSNVGQLGKKFSSKYKSISKSMENIDEYDIKGVIAARYVIASINPDEIRKKFPYPVYIFTFVPGRRSYTLLSLEEFTYEKESHN